jgi:predicted TIM-barrel fold metal-dependent hydrolase
MDHRNLIAIDTHTHAEVSCWNPFDNYGNEYDRAADKYFRSSRRPTIQESIDYYRERKIGLVMFMVDAESNLGRRRIPNEEIAEAAQKNSDIMIAFASIDPHKGKMGAREARRLIEEHGVKGFKFHPTVQGYHPYDRMAWPIYEVIAEHALPAVFHTGHSGIGSGMRCGGGLRPSTSRTCRSSWRTPASPGRTRRSASRRTSPTSGSTSRAGARSTSRSSWCSTPTRC